MENTEDDKEFEPKYPAQLYTARPNPTALLARCMILRLRESLHRRRKILTWPWKALHLQSWGVL